MKSRHGFAWFIELLRKQGKVKLLEQVSMGFFMPHGMLYLAEGYYKAMLADAFHQLVCGGYIL